MVCGDSGFCRPQALRRFEKWGLHYIVGLQKNPALLQRVALAELAPADMYQRAGTKQRMIGEFEYAAFAVLRKILPLGNVSRVQAFQQDVGGLGRKEVPPT